jgi:hypothetical protein
MVRTLRLKLSKALRVTISEISGDDGLAEIHMDVKPMPSTDEALPMLNEAFTMDGIDDTTRQMLMNNIYNIVDNELVVRALRHHMVHE